MRVALPIAVIVKVLDLNPRPKLVSEVKSWLTVIRELANTC